MLHPPVHLLGRHVNGPFLSRRWQELTRLRMTAAGTDAALVHTDGPLQADEAATASATQYLNLRKLSIFGGSNEIQRGVIAKTLLGL